MLIVLQLIFIEHLLCAKHYIKYLLFIFSFNPKQPYEVWTIITIFTGEENRTLEL